MAQAAARLLAMSDFDNFEDFDDNPPVDETPSEPPVEDPEEVVVVTPPSEVDVQFDEDYETDEKELTISVAGAGPIAFKTDGTPITVSAEDAALLVQSPAVKEVN